MSKIDKATTAQTSGILSSFKESSPHLQLLPQARTSSLLSNESLANQRERPVVLSLERPVWTYQSDAKHKLAQAQSTQAFREQNLSSVRNLKAFGRYPS